MTKKSKVLCSTHNAFIGSYFRHLGYDVEIWDSTKAYENVNMLVFTDGPCIMPSMVGQRINSKVPRKDYSFRRDWRERKFFSEFDGTIPRFGFGRGAIMLNNLHGGSMIQHVDKHSSVHDLFFTKTGQVVEGCPSSHTQMMIPSQVHDRIILALADVSTNRYYENNSIALTKNNWADTEIVYYEGTASLCWQPSVFTLESYPLKATLLSYLDSLLKTGDLKL